MELRLIEQAVLFELFADERERELRAVNRNVEIGDDVGNRADVVFMRVGQNDGAHHALVLFQVGDVGNDDIHAEQFLLGEHEARVNDDDVVAGAQGEHVHSELAQPAERDGPYRGLAQVIFLSLIR